MESVVFEGKEYVKASVLAARFRYTADYLGQLCRGRKVDARLVGRAWYINLDSLNTHRSGRYKTSKAPDKTEVASKKPSSNYLSRIDVEPILKKKTVSLVKSTKGSLSEFSVKYEGDDYSLIPRVNKEAISINIPIKPAEAETLKIHKEKEAITGFKAEELPEVYLKGSVKVHGLEEATENVVEEDAKKDLEIKPERMPEPVRPKPVVIRQLKSPLGSHPVSAHKASVVNVVKVPEVGEKVPLQKHEIQQAPLVRPVLLAKIPKTPVASTPVVQKVTQPQAIPAAAKQNAAKPSFKPQAVVNSEAKGVKETVSSLRYLPLFTLLFAVSVSVAILGIRTEIFVQGGIFEDHFVFDFELLKSLPKTLQNF